MQLRQKSSEIPTQPAAAPFVSVYLPTRNRRQLLGRAVNSVLSQDYEPFELIVVNDGSSDATAAYLDDLARSDARVRVIHHAQGSGAPKARNEAIRIARGDFVTGLDDDDFFAPDRISTFVRKWHSADMRSQQPACLYSQTVEMRGGVERISQRPDVVTISDMFVQNLVGNQIFAPRDTYFRAGLFDESLPAWQDLDLFIRVLQCAGPAILVNKGTYIYDDYDRGDRISADPNRVRKAFAIISQKYEADFPESKLHLFMQMFNGYYDIYPSRLDFRYAMAVGLNFEQFKSLAKMAIKSVFKANWRFKAAAA